MSWDARAMLVLAAVWVLIGTLYATVEDLPAGAWAWGAGAAVFAAIAVTVWVADRRGGR